MAQEIAKKHYIEEYGPYGSQCPTNWSMMLEKNESIKEVIIRHDFIVDAIGFVIVDACGKHVTKVFGGSGGNVSKIVLKCNEHIIKISGTHGEYAYSGNQRLITSIKIHTNLCLDGYGPYGLEKSAKKIHQFSTPLPSGGPIVGYFGRHEKYLDSIGIYVDKTQMIEEYGPYGSQGPTNWSMFVHKSDRIKEVIIRHGHIVDAIGFVIVDACGKSTTKFFGGHGGLTSEIELKCDEYITKLSGTHGEYKHCDNQRLITSLRIHTNLCEDGYGPYGLEKDATNIREFSTPLPTDGSIVGYFGRHGKYLDSVGIYVEKECSCA